MIYEFASKHSGCYQTVREATIVYEGDYLVFNILFRTEDSTHLFIHEVSQCALRFDMFSALEMVEIQQLALPVSRLAFINLYDYLRGEADKSPEYSLNGSPLKADASDTASVASLRDPTDVLLMLENSNCFQGLDVYNCHWMSQGSHKDKKYNWNNVLKMSWALHQRFDGLRTSEDHNSYLWMHPQIAISFVSKEGISISFY
jgi:hypothetical protein